MHQTPPFLLNLFTKDAVIPFLQYIVLDDACKREMHQCQHFLSSWNGISLFHKDFITHPKDKQLYTDAAPSTWLLQRELVWVWITLLTRRHLCYTSNIPLLYFGENKDLLNLNTKPIKPILILIPCPNSDVWPQNQILITYQSHHFSKHI